MNIYFHFFTLIFFLLQNKFRRVESEYYIVEVKNKVDFFRLFLMFFIINKVVRKSLHYSYK